MLTQLVEMSGVSAGWLLLAVAGIAVVSYALGCCNGAIMISRGVLKDDIRQHGSGNGGLTNFCRTHGGILSVVVILIDMLKAVISVLLAAYIFSYVSPQLVNMAKYWAGMWCVLGHMFPCTFQFRGGKGVLSGGTIALLVDWRVALAVWGCFIILAVATKFVSLGACVGGLAFIVGSILVYQDPYIGVMAFIMGGLLIFKHRGNIARLCKGTESKFVLKWGEKRAAAQKPAEPEGAAEEVLPEETGAAADTEEL